MAEMVWCQSCKRVVWAYDHPPKADLGGVCNMLQLPCPNCGDVGNFDGWGSDKPLVDLIPHLEAMGGQNVYDWWSAMKVVAKQEEVEWCPSPDNHWFQRPDGTNLWKKYEKAYESRLDE